MKRLIIASSISLVGILSSLFTKYLPENIFGLIVLTFISVFKFGGLIMFFVALVKFSSKEKSQEKLSEVHIIINRNKVFMIALMFLVVGIVLCSSAFLLPLLCGNSDIICPVASIGTASLFFIPMGIVFVVMSFSKFIKYFKNKC